MTADLLTALGIYIGTIAVIGGVVYYLWVWGG
jgi:hypothetical protein